LWHSCWCISFVCWNSNSSLNSIFDSNLFLKYLNPIPKTPTPFPPAPAYAVQPSKQQQPSSAAGRRSRPRPSQHGLTHQLHKLARVSSRAPARLALRPKPARDHRRPALPLPLRLTSGVRWSSPTRAVLRPDSAAAARVRAKHASPCMARTPRRSARAI
jgi:hypothetical protein